MGIESGLKANRGGNAPNRAPEPTRDDGQSSGILPGSPGKVRTTRLLIAAGDALVRWALAETAAARGYQVVEAESWSDLGSPRVAGAPVDLVIYDAELPGAGGLAGLRALRRARPGCPAVVLIAADDRDDVAAALQAGARSVVPKPFDLDDMMARIESGLAET